MVHLKITNSFHFWFKRKCCVCIKWTQTDDASSFVMQVLLIISGWICCITQCGVEPFNLWPLFSLFSQHEWWFSRFHWLACRSEPCSQLAIHSRRCARCARWLDCVHYGWNRKPSAQKLSTEMGIKQWTFHWINFQSERFVEWEAFGHGLSLTETPLCCMYLICCKWWTWTWR